jgi:hypothetical protein
LTYLPSGLAVVSQIKALATALALTDRIAALTDWDAQNIDVTPEPEGCSRDRSRINLANTAGL